MFRFGPGNNLGFAKQPEDKIENPVRLHVAQGIPRAWGADDLLHFLNSQKWTDVSAQSKKRAAWTFMAKAPDVDRDHAAKSWSITIQVAVRSFGPAWKVPLLGPKKVRMTEEKRSDNTEPVPEPLAQQGKKSELFIGLPKTH